MGAQVGLNWQQKGGINIRKFEGGVAMGAWLEKNGDIDVWIPNAQIEGVLGIISSDKGGELGWDHSDGKSRVRIQGVPIRGGIKTKLWSTQSMSIKGSSTIEESESLEPFLSTADVGQLAHLLKVVVRADDEVPG